MLAYKLTRMTESTETYLIVQYGVSEAVLTKTPVFYAASHFQADLTVWAFPTVVFLLVATFKTAKIRL